MEPTQFPSLTAEQLEKLAEHGIDPERSYNQMLAELRAGTWFPGFGRGTRMTPGQRVNKLFVLGYPAALVLTERQAELVRQPRKKTWPPPPR